MKWLLYIVIPSILLWKIWDPTVIFTDELLINDTAMAMANGGSWIVPTLHAEPHFAKPPLVYWFLALLLKIFPHPFITGRFLMTLFAIGIVYIAYKLHPSRWTVLFLTCSIPLIYFTKTTNIDIPNAFFSLLTVYCIFQKKPVWAGSALGLGILTRSYLALFPLAIPLVRKNYTESLKIFVIALLVAAPWHIAAYVVSPDAFVREYISLPLLHIGAIPGDSPSSPFFYLNLIILFPPVILAIFQKNTLWMWILPYLIVLTLSQTRHEWYLLPIIPPLAIIAAKFIEDHKHPLIQWASYTMIIFPLAMIAFLPLPESEIISAVKTAEKYLAPGEPIYELKYSLIPVTSTFPGRPVLPVADKNDILYGTILMRNDSGVIELERKQK